MVRSLGPRPSVLATAMLAPGHAATAMVQARELQRPTVCEAIIRGEFRRNADEAHESLDTRVDDGLRALRKASKSIQKMPMDLHARLTDIASLPVGQRPIHIAIMVSDLMHGIPLADRSCARRVLQEIDEIAASAQEQIVRANRLAVSRPDVLAYCLKEGEKTFEEYRSA